MGDYPMLINGSKTQANERARTELVSVTGYNPKGALNMVVVAAQFAGAEADRPGAARRCPPAWARPGTARWCGHCASAGIDPKTGCRGAQPAAAGRRLGAGIRSGAGAFAVRGVARPAGVSGQGQAALRRRGTRTIPPSTAWSSDGITPASTRRCSTRSCRPSSTPPTSSTHKPLEAAKIVAEGSGLPQEVVYLYNGPGRHLVRHHAQAVAGRCVQR